LRPNDYDFGPFFLRSNSTMLLSCWETQQTQHGEAKMLTKIALAAALTLGTAFAALAANENDTAGGYRELGPGGVVTDGVNPVFHRSLRSSAGSSYGYVPADSHKHAPAK
jgi:hypothetical protein